MTRLKRGDACPLCGQPITTEDPFILGYLTCVRDILEKGRFENPDPKPETAKAPEGESQSVTEAELFSRYLASGWEDIIDFYEYKRRFIMNGGTIVEVEHGKTDG